jgi:hypothetical protein
MPWFFQHDTHRIDLEELPLERWATIEAGTGMRWHEVLGGHIGDATVAMVVAKEAAAHLGIDPPKLTIKTLVTTFVWEPGESSPTEFTDGMPDPKATDTEAVTI